jgi:basic amino acid/polyamine antiporter, APA family
MTTFEDRPAAGPDPVQQGSAFARESTGLVREVSTFTASILGASGGAVGQYPIFVVPFALGLFAAHSSWSIYVAIILSTVFTAATLLNYAMLTASMPRSGSDYVFTTRLVHPVVGFTGNFTWTFWQLFAAGAWIVLAIGAVVSPLFAILGSLTGSGTLVDWSSTVTERGWTIGLSIFLIALMVVLCCLGTQLALRVNAVLWLIGMFSLFLLVVILLFTSHDEFVQKYNELAGSASAFDDTITNARSAGFSERNSALMVWPITALVMTVYGVAFWATYLGGEIRQARSYRRQMWIVGLPLVVTAIPVILITFVALRTFGYDFLSSVAYLSFVDPDTLPTEAAGGPVMGLTALSAGNDFVAGLFIFTFLAWVLTLLLSLIIVPIRCALAWSLDQLIPSALVTVNRRFHTPVRLTVLCGGVVAAVAVLAAYNDRVFALFATSVLASLFFAAAMCAMSAIAFPRRMPELYQQTPTARVTILGVPSLVISGVVSLVFTVGYLAAYGWFHNEFGITRNYAIGVFSPILVALVIYAVARFIRAREGIPMELAFKQIPPE